MWEVSLRWSRELRPRPEPDRKSLRSRALWKCVNTRWPCPFATFSTIFTGLRRGDRHPRQKPARLLPRLASEPVAMLMDPLFNIPDLRLPQEIRPPEEQGSSLAVIVTLSVLQRGPSRRRAYSTHGSATSHPRSTPRGVPECSGPSRDGFRSSRRADHAKDR